MTDAYVESRRNFHVNALGVLQFGLQPSLEFGGNANTFVIRLRILSLGLLPYVIAGADGGEFKSGLGLGGGLRHYSGNQGSQRGFFLGGGIEVIGVTTAEEDTEYDTTYLVPQGEIGYRWARSRYFIGVGVLLGLAAVTSATYDDPEDRVFGNVSLELGMYF